MSGNGKKPVTRREFQDQIIKRAQADREFKEVLLDNPKEALGQLGAQLPAEVEVKV